MKNFYFSTLTYALLILLFVAGLGQGVQAQAPSSFKYQTVVRDAMGQVVANQAVRFRIQILEGTIMGVPRYIETHAVTTNDFGLVSMNIGEGTVFAGTWGAIDWDGKEQFLRIDLDVNGGTSYINMGTSQMVSVPYALHANTADEAKTAEAVTGPINELDPDFNASLAASITSADTANWNNKLATEADPVYGASIAAGITAADVANWNSKLATEADPVYGASTAAGITGADIANWNAKLDSEVDGDVTNEIQAFRVSLTGDTLFLSQSNWVIIPGLTLANPRCDDGIQNGLELGVDCGGPECVPCEVEYLLDEGYTPCQIARLGIPYDSLYGKFYQGGMIFYVDTVNCFGMVADTADLDSAIFGGTWSYITATGVRTGQANTTYIVNNSGTLATAAKACDDLQANGYSDWFLPSEDAWNALAFNLAAQGMGNFQAARYWSSTESSSPAFGRAANLSTGQWDNVPKATRIRVRAVRSFNQ